MGFVVMTLLESFDNNNPERGSDSVVRQMHQKMGGGVSHTQRHVNSAIGGGLESNHVCDTGTGTVSEYTTQAK